MFFACAFILGLWYVDGVVCVWFWGCLFVVFGFRFYCVLLWVLFWGFFYYVSLPVFFVLIGFGIVFWVVCLIAWGCDGCDGLLLFWGCS